MAQVHDDELLAGVELFLQFINGDAGDAQITKKSPAGDKLLGDVGGQGSEDQDQEPAAERSEPLRDALDLTAEHIAEAEESASPEKRTGGIEEEETPSAHVEDASERRGDGAKAGNEFGDQE